MTRQTKLNTAMRTALQINSLNANLLRGTASQYLDAKHPRAWSDYGYPETITNEMHEIMYERCGFAKNGIESAPTICWGDYPVINQGVDEAQITERKTLTLWEVELNQLFKKHLIWQKLREADIKQGIYQFSAMLIHVRGNTEQADWSKPLDMIKEHNIEMIETVKQSELTPSQYEQDKSSARFNMPTMYTYTRENKSASGSYAVQNETISIHWSRVITFAEGDITRHLLGTPVNEAGYNALVTLTKIIGAGGEGFWKNSSMKTIYSSKSGDTGGAPSADESEEFNEEISDFVEGMDKSLFLGDLDGKVLSAALENPEPYFNIALSEYAASIQTPKKIIEGTQTGKLASEEDGQLYLTRMNSRRENFCNVMISNVLEWLFSHGVLKRSEHTVTWSDLLEPTDADKLNIAIKMSDVNQKMAAFGVTFTQDEIRAIAGYMPLSEDENPVTDDDEDLSEDDERE